MLSQVKTASYPVLVVGHTGTNISTLLIQVDITNEVNITNVLKRPEWLGRVSMDH